MADLTEVDHSVDQLEILGEQEPTTLGLDLTQFDAALDQGTFASAVAADIAQGQSVGVNGTPTFFINGVAVVGAVPYSELQSVIDEELAANP